AFRDGKREGSPGYGDHLGAGLARQPGQDGAEKADADDRDRLTGAYAAAAENVHGTAERLAGEGDAGKGLRQADHVLGRPDVEFGIAVGKERRHAVTDPDFIDFGSHGINDPPGFMTQSP